MLKKTVSIMLLALMCASCAKREPHTIMAYQPGDENRSCDSLLSEVSYYHNKINEKNGEVNDRTGKNVALGVTGAFLIVPLFFMDLSGAEKTELESYKMRIERLQLVALEKKCSFTPVKFEEQKKEQPENAKSSE
ncbi:hypothetical protein [Seleniivibrio woodruffii]|jgi:hypothetical protein|uniref:Lipoprotein n=1 Tax=Seleniivibrio woodruffii TaxID=1078050 RepID=A0A4R1K3G0_9BACT|nr:hypothetical protein [Seleniivibrio woodruffii]TCK58430.1 hypothetical protein C8D98_2632 [Seleniivibrio woodruffii]TVZ36803.1 hypothetical protein OF66_2441 [Seleniivibrio woodruffii]